MTGTIAPVRKVRLLACPPEHAFRVFTEEIGQWWPTATHAIGSDVRDVILEGRVGGSMHEVAEDGSTTPWGEVIVWDPPRRVAFSWHLQRHEGTHVDVTFGPTEDGCEMLLVHSGWEAWSDEGPERRDEYDHGWDVVLAAWLARVRPH